MAYWKTQTPYQLRDVDGRSLDAVEARAILADRYQIPKQIRKARMTTRGTGRRSKESQRAQSPARPATTLSDPEPLDIR